jgi:hypothetical protein
MRQTVSRSVLLLLLGAAAAAGCGDPLSLLPPVFENRVDTVSLWAASRTPVTDPSGFIISQRSAVRLDQVSSFDFFYDVSPAGEHFFLPLAAVVNTGRTAGNPGFREETAIAFDAITLAPQENYVSQDTVRFRVGDIFYARSQVESSCGLGIPYYSKLQILAIDNSEFKVRFKILANINCGYRSLEIGLPKK